MLSVPGKIVEIVDATNRLATVDVMGTVRRVHYGPIETVAPGEWVLVYMDLAVSRLDEAEAQETLRVIRDLARASEERP